MSPKNEPPHRPSAGRPHRGIPPDDDVFRHVDGGDVLFLGARRIATGKGARLLHRILQRAVEEDRLHFLRREFVREQDLICSPLNTGFSTHLARVRAALEAHDAPVRIRSPQRGGFHLEVVRPFGLDRAPGSGPAVLLVAGHPLVLHGLRTLVEGCGPTGRIDTAVDWVAAGIACRQRLYDLVVVDLEQLGIPENRSVDWLSRPGCTTRVLLLADSGAEDPWTARLRTSGARLLGKSASPRAIQDGIRAACAS